MTEQPPTMREFLEQRMTQQDKTLEAILEQAQKTNGRMSKAETAIALLQWAYGLGAAIAAGYFFEWIKR